MESHHEEEAVTLQTLKGGAASEMFELAWDQVLQNIADINTTLKDRTIILKVVLKPSEDRNYIGVSISCDTKLQGQDPEKTMCLLKFDKRGRTFAVGTEPRQQEIPFGTVTPISGKAK